MEQQLQFVVDFVYNPYSLQIICLLGQFIVTIRSTYLLILNKEKYPIKQNTNILTILILFSFFICNIILLITRIIIQSKLSSEQPSFFEQTCCFWHIKQVQYLSYVHLFFSQMLIPAIALKMFRVSIAYYPILQKQWIINIMKNKKSLLIGVVIWASTFTIIQAIFNNIYLLDNHQHNIQKYGGLQLYQFFCAKYPSNLPDQLWLVQFSKTTLTLIIYIIQYYFSGIIPQTYNFKWQYNSQFIIFMLPILARNILDMSYTSNLLIWYHTQFFMYYLSTITIAWYHRRTKQLPINDNPSYKSLQQIKNHKFIQPMHLFKKTQFVKVFRLYLKKHKRQPIYIFINTFFQLTIQLYNIQQRPSIIQSQIQNYRYKQKIQQLIQLYQSQINLYKDLVNFQEKYIKILRKNKFYNSQSSIMNKFEYKISQLSKYQINFMNYKNKFQQNMEKSSQQIQSKYLKAYTDLGQEQTKLNKIFKDYQESFLIQQLKMFTKDSIFTNYIQYVQKVKQNLGDILSRLKIQLKTY